MKSYALLLTPLLFALPAFVSAKPSDGYAISTNNTCKIYPNQYIPYRQVKWSGDCKDGFAEGYGTATWTCQRQSNCGYTVTGTYRQGKLHGRATAQALDLKDEIQIMTADYQDGVAVGYQKIVFDNGDIYEGEPQSNTNIYRGTYTFGKGEFESDRYEGEMIGGRHHGFGTYWYANEPWVGDRYEGEWQHDQRTGKGKYFFANGNYYEGDFVNNSMHGKGVFIWANGDRYEGEFKNNHMHGKGTFHYANGIEYTGDFWHGTQTGYGTTNGNHGVRYTGSLIDGGAFGFGTRTIPKPAYADKPRSPLGHWQGDVFIEQGWFYDNKLAFACDNERHCRQLAKNNDGWQKIVREYDEIFEELKK
ncbi:MORN repeat-containing protein [Moraxella nasicaprae]|uniref:MORN repeat-containing protein n=1 Tax=Moraxella nasicaprae TaxID=2904122 RepID=A0ABY6F3P5_9GAMM|nr:hypothetical protein [Moraxella nasicaprae]UXZ04708.1 hypothetical protein LU297_09110 [Moraxella nasicaprae]